MAGGVVDRIESRYAQSRGGRIKLSDFSHGRKWRADLEDAGVMEVVDRDTTAAWLLSDVGMAELMAELEALRDENEALQVQRMVEARRGRGDWRSGEELASAAKAALAERRAAAREAVHGR